MAVIGPNLLFKIIFIDFDGQTATPKEIQEI